MPGLYSYHTDKNAYFLVLSLHWRNIICLFPHYFILFYFISAIIPHQPSFERSPCRVPAHQAQLAVPAPVGDRSLSITPVGQQRLKSNRNQVSIITLLMSNNSHSLSEAYKAEAQRTIDSNSRHLSLIERLLQSEAQNFFYSFEGKANLTISQPKLRRTHILAANHNNKAFEARINEDLSDFVDEDFSLGFNKIVEKRMASIREKAERKRFRGCALLLSKRRQRDGVANRPFFYRLDYTLVLQGTDYLPLREAVSQVFLLAYRLSAVKKDHFAPQQIDSEIEDGFQGISHYSNCHQGKATVASLIAKVHRQRQICTESSTVLYKELERETLVAAKSDVLPQYLQSLERFGEIGLAIVWTKWEDDFEYLGTGFYLDKSTLLTSVYSVSERDGSKVSSVRVCLNPSEKLEWTQVKQSQILSQQSLGIIRVEQPQQKKRSKIYDQSSALPQYSNRIYVYGYKFERNLKGEIAFNPSLSVFEADSAEPFDSFLEVASKASIGSLVFCLSDSRIRIFGVYNPLNGGSLNFSLFKGSIFDSVKNRLDPDLAQIVILDDDRTLVAFDKLKELPYSAIGLITSTIQKYDNKHDKVGQANGIGHGTGTFITPNLIITCAHNVLGYKQQQNCTYIATSVKFYPGFSSMEELSSLGPIRQNKSIKHYQISKYDIYVPWSYCDSYLKQYDERRIYNDVAIIHLKDKTHSSSLSIKSVPQNQKEFWDNSILHICGYPWQFKGQMKEHQGKGIANESQIKDIQGKRAIKNMLYYRINTSAGNSGSAVTYRNQKNEFQVVAIHTKGTQLQVAEKMMNSGPLLVNQNFAFVLQKVNTIGKGKKSKDSSLDDFYYPRFG